MNRVYNFAPGPSMLPEAALRQAADELLSYNGTGMSVMEMSHRSKAYQDVFDDAEATLRALPRISLKNFSKRESSSSHSILIDLISIKILPFSFQI